MREVCEKFGITENRIHPVRNYSSQTECVNAMDILILRGLRQLVRNSKAFLKDTVERRKSGEMQRQREEAALKQRKKGKKPNNIFESKEYFLSPCGPLQ